MRLEHDHIHLWLARCSEIDDPQLLARYRSLMNAEELARLERYRFERDRQRHLVTRALVRTCLSRYAAVPPHGWQFTTGVQDKPELHAAPLPLRFNISHSGDFVVCAVALEFDVGVDIEHMERANDVLAIARHFFSATELAALQAAPAARQRDRFFDYWTLKEAYMKARGEGIALGLGNFSFHLADEREIAVEFSAAIDDHAPAWRFRLFDPAPGYRMALAWKRAAATTVYQFHTIPLLADAPQSAP